jgi:TonB C terminal
MDRNRKLTIAEWVDAPIPIRAHPRSARRYWSPGVVGLAGTLILHALVLQSALTGMRSQRFHLPDIQAVVSTLNKTDNATFEALVLLDLSASARTNTDNSKEVASVSMSRKGSSIAIMRPDPSAMLTVKMLEFDTEPEKASEAPVDTGNGTELARLFGIYSGQIQARVERIWRRPRTPINEGGRGLKTAADTEYFLCQVQIVQDSVGNVQEILLPICNGSFAWQHSLVAAIQQSSPLPAPPNPSVFNHTMTLVFTGYVYSADSADDEYEIITSQFVNTRLSSDASRANAPAIPR